MVRVEAGFVTFVEASGPAMSGMDTPPYVGRVSVETLFEEAAFEP